MKITICPEKQSLP